MQKAVSPHILIASPSSPPPLSSVAPGGLSIAVEGDLTKAGEDLIFTLSQKVVSVVPYVCMLMINPRCTCTGAPEGYGTWSVCVSVQHHESCHYVQLSVQQKVPTASAQSGKHFKYGIFSKNALFKSYGVKKPTT